jgi:hypothetical protein
MPKNEKTGTPVGKIASQALRDPKSITPSEVRKLAGSVLTQRPDNRK